MASWGLVVSAAGLKIVNSEILVIWRSVSALLITFGYEAAASNPAHS